MTGFPPTEEVRHAPITRGRRRRRPALRRRRSPDLTRVSVSSAGAQADGISFGAAVSRDGRYVAFGSDATGLVPGDTNGAGDVLVRDRRAGTTERISVSSAGVQGDGESRTASITPEGRYAVFASRAANLVPGDTNAGGDVFLRDRRTGTTTRVSVAPGGGQADGDSSAVTMTPDGRYVAFDSLASNLVPGGTPGPRAVFVRDLTTGATARIAIGSNPSLSADGRIVAFHHRPDPATERQEVFAADRRTGVTRSVSGPGGGYSYQAVVSGDGRVVAFHSTASDLVPGDTNDVGDIFARRLG